MFAMCGPWRFVPRHPKLHKCRGKESDLFRSACGTAVALQQRVHGRRSHPRFSASNSDGVLSLLTEVTVRQVSGGEFVVLDRESRNIDELLTLERVVNGSPVATPVRVVASRPIVRNGKIFHELRLTLHYEKDGESR